MITDKEKKNDLILSQINVSNFFNWMLIYLFAFVFFLRLLRAGQRINRI